MSIISINYFLLIGLLLILYYAVSGRFQWAILLVGSLTFFCMAGNPLTIVYLFSAAAVTWYASIKIREESKEGMRGKHSKKAKLWLALALTVDLGILAALKYLNFILLNSSRIVNLFAAEKVSWSVDWPVALGVSFYTLQIVGYLLDSYWNICDPQRNFFKFLLFSSFFPQMISGPISRYDQLGGELYSEHRFSKDNLRAGGWRILIGVFKKVVLAENLSILVPYLMTTSCGRIGPLALLGLAIYVIQIYADFSGYMDIVLGTAKCFGITMTENFNAPFSSRSIQEFWQRWHITLGLWLRNYVMYPLLHSSLWVNFGKRLKAAGYKKAAKKAPMWLAMLILWFCMGLWHGGGWNYIAEGIWFWAVIVLGDLLKPYFIKITAHWNGDNRLWVFFQRARTALIYSVGATFFHYRSLREGWRFLVDAFSPLWVRNLDGVKKVITLFWKAFCANHGFYDIFVLILPLATGMAVFMIHAKLDKDKGGIAMAVSSWPLGVRWLLAVFLVYVMIFLGVYGPGYNAADFIYGGF